MLPFRDSRISKLLLGAFFLLALGYGLFEARGLVFGPRITVSTSTAATTTQFITIAGRADRIATLKMNGAAIPVTEDGAFEEPYLLAPGINRILIDATDRYGHTDQTLVEIVYEPPVASTTPPLGGAGASATSTAASSTAAGSASTTAPIAPGR